MPYTVRRLPHKNLYKVYNTNTKAVHSYGTTLDKAKKQVRLLYMIDNKKMKGKGASASVPILRPEEIALSDEMMEVDFLIYQKEIYETRITENNRLLISYTKEIEDLNNEIINATNDFEKIKNTSFLNQLTRRYNNIVDENINLEALVDEINEKLK